MHPIRMGGRETMPPTHYYYLEGHGDLVSRFLTPITHIPRIINLLTSSAWLCQYSILMSNLNTPNTALSFTTSFGSQGVRKRHGNGTVIRLSCGSPTVSVMPTRHQYGPGHNKGLHNPNNYNTSFTLSATP